MKMTNHNQSKTLAKKSVGHAAAALIQNNMLIGLGTGTTAYFFIESLIERCRNTGLKISAVATSQRSAEQASAGGIELYDINRVKSLDMTVDGADEIDHKKRMIKGGGGALLREKIIASISREMVVIIDEEKLVKQLGHFPLPIEVVTFAHELTLYRIKMMGFQANFRLTSEQDLYVTDNGNYIIDIHFPKGCQSPEEVNAKIRDIPGVVEIGFFFNLAGRILVGYPDGHVKIIP